MKKIFIFLLFTNFLFGQKSNINEHYFDENNNSISKFQFYSSNENFLFKKISKNESQLTGNLILRKYRDNLTLENRNKIIDSLELSTKSKFERNKTLIFHYYKNSSSKIDKEMNNKKYKKILQKYPNIKSYFIVENGIINKKSNILTDTLNFIQRQIIKKDVDDVNYFILKSNGEITIIYGEYDLIGILDNAT